MLANHAIAGVFLSVEHMGLGYPLSEVREHRFIAEDAVNLARWLSRHRLRLQEQHLEIHDCGLSRDLESRLRKNGGELREIELKENPRIAKGLKELLRRCPKHFKQKSVRTGSSESSTAIVVLVEKSFGSPQQIGISRKKQLFHSNFAPLDGMEWISGYYIVSRNG